MDKGGQPVAPSKTTRVKPIFVHDPFLKVKLLNVLAPIILALPVLAGCTYAYNERAVHSPDWKYAATVYVRGSYGRSYDAVTTKHIAVSFNALALNAKERVEQEIKQSDAAGIWRSDHLPGAVVLPSDPLLFYGEYRAKGADIEWNAVWEDQGRVAISFYEYGRDASPSPDYDNPTNEPAHSVLMLRYSIDPVSQRYREEAIK